MKPRPYQIEAKREAAKALRKHRSAIVVMPTGCGKTVTFADIIGDVVRAGKRVLVLAHREELLDQAADKIRTMTGIDVAIEQGSRKETDGHAVVVACVFSIIRRLDRFRPDDFALIIVDEAHRSLAVTYRTLLDYFAPTRYLGFTATPNRGDELALAQVFDAVAFDMTAADAVREGWLVPFNIQVIKLDSLDLSKVRARSGELAAGELGAVMSEIAVLREAIEPAVKLAGRKQAIVFTVTIAHMHAVAETVRQVAEEQALRLVVATVDGTTPKDERVEIMRAFRAGEINWLVNVEVATEGFDAPAVEAVICLRPTLSRALFIQMLGRGGRPLPGIVDGPETAAERRAAIAASAKPECLVLDFAANSGKHELANGMDLLGGDFELPEQRDAERLLAEGKADNLLEALEQARAARQAKIAEVLARNGDPFALFGITAVRDRWHREMTPKQREKLDPVTGPRNMDFREANDLLAELARREDLGLCLYSQAFLLVRLGHPLAPIREMSRREAGDKVRVLAATNWARPRDWSAIG